MASPSLGGQIEVSTSMCKKWQIGAYDFDDEFEGDFDDIVPPPQVASEDTPMLMDDEEQAELGFYNVAKILDHKFRGGWKFLVWWENFPPSASTWEPISSFILPNGSVNSVFKEYCLSKGLSNILNKALSQSVNVVNLSSHGNSLSLGIV